MKRSFYGNINAFFEGYLVWWTQNTLTSLSGRPSKLKHSAYTCKHFRPEAASVPLVTFWKKAKGVERQI